jgi:hypothetical protein
MVRIAVIFVVVIVIGWLLAIGLGRSASFQIRIQNGRAHARGSIPAAARAAIEDFIDALHLDDGVQIIGFREVNGLRLEFRGSFDDALRQRIRNFIFMKLR